MQSFHAVVWIDHDEAHVIHFTREQAETLTLHSKHRRGHLHHKSGGPGDGKAAEDPAFFAAVEAALVGTREILIVGPAGAKDELDKHIRLHSKALAACVVGVETIDHPSDGQLLAMARKYFRAADSLL